MQTINYEDLRFNKNAKAKKGSYASVKKCFFDNDVYAYKEFNESSYLKGKIRKLSKMSNINEPFLLTPKFWVIKNKTKCGYLTKYCDGKNIININKNLIEKLKTAKNLIIKMHSNNIIHGDLIGSNIMCDDKHAFIIDFDNASYKASNINIKNANDYALEYLEKFGINKALDVYLFNLLTYSLLNNCDFYMVRNNIYKNNFGIFTSKDQICLCRAFSLEKSYSDKDFLIDTIDDDKIIV